MASWVMHLQMAERLLECGYELDRLPFLIGNVAPDTGSPEDFRGEYDPPKHLTHWEELNGKIGEERFYKEEIEAKSNNWERLSFLLGYYAHLVGDSLWRDIIWQPLYSHEDYGEHLQQDKGFLEEIYQDIHAYDVVYLKQHPEFIYFKDFAAITDVPNYLDLFCEGAIARHIQHIKRHYREVINKYSTHTNKFISNDRLAEYVIAATDFLGEKLTSKGITPKG